MKLKPKKCTTLDSLLLNTDASYFLRLIPANYFWLFAAEDTTETINEADKIKQMLKTGAIGNDPRKIKEMMMKLKESKTEKGLNNNFQDK